MRYDICESESRQRVYRAAVVCTAFMRRAVECAVHVSEGGFRVRAVAPAGEAVEYAFCAGGRDFENRADAVCTTKRGRSVERAVYVG